MPQVSPRKKSNSRTFNSQQSLNGAIKSICDIMRRSNCAGALQYVPELTWILFLRILDEREVQEAERARAVDPGCGTGGFLAQAYEHMTGPNHSKIASPDQLEALKRRTFYGREKD